MILQRLAEYYHRLANDPDYEIAPEGFERKEILCVIVLDATGTLVNIKDTRQPDKSKKLRTQIFLVPQGVKKTSGIKSNLLWDSAEYVLGLSLDGTEDSKNAERHAAFKQTLLDVFGPQPDDEGIRAIQYFLDRGDFSAVTEHPNWPSIKAAKTGSFTFALAGDDAPIIAMRPTVQQKIANLADQGGDHAGEGYCLITAEHTRIARMHTSIKGVRDAQSSGANIVSFNFDSATSFGKKQGANSPIGIPAMFAYTTALNHLLGKDSQQRFQAGDASVVFWAKNATPLESNLRMLFDEPPKENPERMRDAVQVLQASARTGHKPILDDDTPFYILGLSPNIARISVRFWRETTVKELAKNILRHFEDTALVHGGKDSQYLSLFRLLNATAAQGKSENVPPNLAGVMLEAVLSGAPYPYSLLQNAVMRNKVEQNVPYARAAIIKACLNRLFERQKFYGKDMMMPLEPTLNEQDESLSYQYGRMFRMFENIQWHALGDVNASVRDKYYGSASSNPALVFPLLIRNAQNHLTKVGKEKPGLQRNLDKELGELTMRHRQGFKKSLNIEEQGLFAVGYYHQKYKKSENTLESTPEEKEAA